MARSLEPLAGSIPELADATATLERLAEETREVAYTPARPGRELGRRPAPARGYRDPPGPLSAAVTRFHCGADELAARRAETEAKLAALVRDDTELRGLDAPLAEAWDAVKSCGRGAVGRADARRPKISAGRSSPGSSRWDSRASRLTVEVESRDLGDDPTGPRPPESGRDRVEMLFLANPGEAPRPLRKIASGGELSRVTLAAKTVLAGADRVPTLIFDEIDTGVGGRLGACARQDAGRAGPAPSGRLRDSPAPARQLRAPPVGHSQADGARTHPDHDLTPRATPIASSSWPSCSGAIPPRKEPARKPWPCCTKPRPPASSAPRATPVPRAGD